MRDWIPHLFWYKKGQRNRPAHSSGPSRKVEKEVALKLLQEAIGQTDGQFREGQWEAIDQLVNHHCKLLIVQRTGWGKSSVYFIATRLLRDQGAGPTLIISPLLALMRNQIEAAQRLSLGATTINSTNTDQWETIKRRIKENSVDAILISPERLSNAEFVEEVLLPVAHKIGLVVVDEAHCISQWGHDFRTDYRRIVNILKQMPANMPVLATTATANDRVVQDIKQQIGDLEIQRGPLIRKSLRLQTIKLSDQAARLAWLAKYIPQLPGTGIIYTLTKQDADRVTNWLNQHHIKAAAYYSGVNNPEYNNENSYRQAIEQQLLNNQLKVVVATSALGMGYDKPDLGFVIHFQAPQSVVTYYQQVGRAGRAIDQAYGILLSGREDKDIHAYFRRTAFPEEAEVMSILQELEQSNGLSTYKIQQKVNLRYPQVRQALEMLRNENPPPVFNQGSRWYRTATKFKVDTKRIEFLTQQRLREWQEIQKYVDHQGCLMNFLSRALDDPTQIDCGKCANCSPKSALSTEFPFDLSIRAKRFLKQNQRPLRLKKRVAENAFSVYDFQDVLPPELQGETGRILSQWGDAGWGDLVAECKHENYFDDILVDAVIAMIKQWNPQPTPKWVTCVPSLQHPKLVPSLAHRVASGLGLPFINCITKIKTNKPQKKMYNQFYQCKNLDGVFSIKEMIRRTPVLLIDDIVNSAWTLTILAALLRQAGTGPVFPLALATTVAG